MEKRIFPDTGDFEPGMSLREHFAGLAMQGMLADPNTAGASAKEVARTALLCADALIKALGEGK